MALWQVQKSAIILCHHPLRLNYGSRIYILFSLFWFGFSDEKTTREDWRIRPPWKKMQMKAMKEGPLWRPSANGLVVTYEWLVRLEIGMSFVSGLWACVSFCWWCDDVTSGELVFRPAFCEYKNMFVICDDYVLTHMTHVTCCGRFSNQL